MERKDELQQRCEEHHREADRDGADQPHHGCPGTGGGVPGFVRFWIVDVHGNSSLPKKAGGPDFGDRPQCLRIKRNYGMPIDDRTSQSLIRRALGGARRIIDARRLALRISVALRTAALAQPARHEAADQTTRKAAD
jgi:hypothetical protein